MFSLSEAEMEAGLVTQTEPGGSQSSRPSCHRHVSHLARTRCAADLNAGYGCGGVVPAFLPGGSTGQAASLPPHPPTVAPASAAAPSRMKDSMPHRHFYLLI